VLHAGNDEATRELMQAHVDIFLAMFATLTTGADFNAGLTDLARAQIVKEQANAAKIVELGQTPGFKFSLEDVKAFRANVVHTGDVAQMQWAYDAVMAFLAGM
jgi:hypothetical protein